MPALLTKTILSLGLILSSCILARPALAEHYFLCGPNQDCFDQGNLKFSKPKPKSKDIPKASITDPMPDSLRVSMYHFSARAGQNLTITLNDRDKRYLVFWVFDGKDTTASRPLAQAQSGTWSGRIPKTGRYLIQVLKGGPGKERPTSFDLTALLK